MPPSIRTLAALVASAGCALPAVAQDVAPHVPGEIIVRFEQAPDEAALAGVAAVLGEPVRWTGIPHAPFARGTTDAHPLSRCRIAVVDPGADVAALSGAVSGLPGVDFATTNNTPDLAGLPDDPLFPMQWSHTKINTPAAWDIATGSGDIIVGVVDTGCLIAHEDLQAHIWVNDDPTNGIDDDGNGFVDDTFGWDFANNDAGVEDVFGHGTQVAGIVGAPIDNGLGIAGIANVTLMTAKWWHVSGSDATVAASVFYAVDNGAHVVNMSLSCECVLPLTEEAVDYAHANGVVVVASTGNAGTPEIAYPSGYETVMAVSAVNQLDQRPGFSNFGAHLDVAAPSPGILSTGSSGPSEYDFDFGGTSAAAPHVAGLAALVLSVDPSLQPDEVRALINGNATDLGDPGFDEQFGHGRIDVGATIAAIVACPADVDRSGAVDVGDLVALITAWGSCLRCPEDLDGNGAVDVADLVALISAWGPC